jgi:hypothetical protein
MFLDEGARFRPIAKLLVRTRRSHWFGLRDRVEFDRSVPPARAVPSRQKVAVDVNMVSRPTTAKAYERSPASRSERLSTSCMKVK